MEQKNFDPDGVGVDNRNLFRTSVRSRTAELVLISAPWDVTVSYGAGRLMPPDAIIEASTQLDFHDPLAPRRLAPRHRHGRCGLFAAGVFAASAGRRRTGDRPPRRRGGCLEDDYVVRKVRRVNRGACR